MPSDLEWAGNTETLSPAEIAAYRVGRSVVRSNQLPVVDDRGSPFSGPADPFRPSYIIEPDLQETQNGMQLPPGIVQDAGGALVYKDTGQPVPIVRRPGALPIADTPEGYKVVMPKLLDVASNIMGNVAAPRVAAKAGEMVLGSGITRKAEEIAKETGPFYSQLERTVNDAKINLATPEQWLGYLRNQPGVKAEELQHVLGEMPKEGMLSKEQIGEIVKNNKVELKEKVLGGENSDLYKKRDGLQAQLRTEKDLDKRADIVIEIENINQKLNGELGKTNVTKYHQYQLPGGGGNYKETLLQLPSKEEEIRKAALGRGLTEQEKSFINNEFKSGHWDEPNVMAHIRHNDRIVEGKKTLHIEEIQSDWHQKGRKEGYKINDKQKAELENIDNKLMNGLEEKDIGNPNIDEVLKTAIEKKVLTSEEARNYKDFSKGENSKIPDAPFKKTWDELALKRMIHKAANEGYNAISWTPGEAQAARYDLSKQVKNIGWNKSEQVKDNSIVRIDTNEGKNIALQIDKKGNVVASHPSSQASQFDGKNLADVIGKEHAEKILAKESGDLNGEGLKIGGEGMKSFYDKMLVDKANALGKKYGSKVEQKELPHNKIYKIEPIDIPTLTGSGSRKIYDVRFNEKGGEDRLVASYNNKAEAEKKLADLQAVKGEPIHYLLITKELREKAKGGFPLFSSSPVMVPVDYQPQFEDKKSKFKLTPVAGNPFQ